MSARAGRVAGKTVLITGAAGGLGEAMVGINVGDLPAPHRLAERGW